ncbi:ribosome biogenesis protein NOP53 [Maniola hyperantus]|uniref:ribosome biogenesis protein NOP53 n=1 Tax=Aphantopus hyperantus TaxID=2795564 RepID=UPI001569EC65|nr:ribosome biogenesis protein NOP53 [Maniola hyperantus]
MTIVKKKKRVSKRTKTAWRKHCDITDVEAYLEDQRLEERLGKFDTKPDEELFVLDTKGEDVKDVKPDVKPLSAKQQRRAKLAETPKCFEILLSSSKVPDPNAKRNTVKKVGTKPTDLSKLSVKRQLAKGILQKKLELMKKDKRCAREKRKKAQTVRQTYDKNIWDKNDLEAKGIPETLIDDFISPEAQLHNVPVTKRLRPKPAPPRTVVTRAAVEVPHPGVSYNPSFKEHQELLQEVVQHEQKMMKREAHLYRVTTGLFSKVTLQEKENQWREEMSAGLPQPHNPAADPQPDEEPSDNEYKAVNPPVRNKKKDHKTRRKQKERLVELEKLKRQKIDKQKITDIYKLRKIQASVSKKEEQNAELRTKRTSKRLQQAATALPALNAHKAPVKEPDFVDPKQLSGDLRNISGSANLLRDRFQSLQRRGALAASKIMMTKRKKLKKYFKPGHKVTDQDVDKFLKRSAVKPL